MQLNFVTNFNEAAVRLQRIEAGLPVKQRALLDALVPTFIAIQEQALRDATPEGRGWDAFSTSPERDAPRLKDTTKTDVIRTGSNQYQSNALIQTYQTKRVLMKAGITGEGSEATMTSLGDAAELSNIIVRGRRAPSETIRPLIRGALYWPALGHPIASSAGGPAAPNDYFQTARESALPEIEVAAAAGVASMSDSLFTLT